MIKISTLLCLMALCVSAQGQKFSKEIRDFDHLIVSRGVEVMLEKSNSNTLDIEISGLDENDLILENSGGYLRIKVKTRALWEEMKDHHWWVKVTVPYKTLDYLEAGMGSSLHAREPIESSDLEIEASMGSEVDLPLKVAGLRLEASMGSEVDLEGEADEFEVNASMGSEVDAHNLECKTVKARATMGSEVRVNCTEEFDGKAGMGGSITVSGNPEKFYESTSMGGDISSRSF